MTTLHTRLFGRFDVSLGEEPIDGADMRGKRWELFCYLLLRGRRPHHRDFLADQLWSFTDSPRTRKYLRQALWQLQGTFEDGPSGLDVPLLLVDVDWIQVNPEAPLLVDARQLEDTSEALRGIAGHEMDVAQASRAQAAVKLYRGDLLEGWYQSWCVLERERYKSMNLALLEKLISWAEITDQTELALALGQRLLQLDPAHERTHRRLMFLHHLTGDRTAAMRQFGMCVAALQCELQVDPEPATIELYDKVRASVVPRVDDGPVHRGASGLDAASVRLTIDRLRAALADATALADQLVESVEAGSQTPGGRP